MLAREFTSAASFLERVKAFLFEAELENNLILSSVLAIARQPIAGIRFFAVENGPLVEAAAILTTQGRLVVSSRTASSGSALAKTLHDTKVRTVFAPTMVAEDFANTDPRFKKHGSQTLMLCHQVGKTRDVGGIFRTATPRDLRLLLEWTAAFTKECRLDDSVQESEETVRRFVEMKQAFVWETSKAPAAMAAFGGITPLAARVSLVYTAPLYRNRGYAKTLVHRLTHRLLETKKAVVLFADTANRTSIGLYENLGYEKILEFAEFRLAKA
jgi:predicted GNAT family acetyltransferase